MSNTTAHQRLARGRQRLAREITKIQHRLRVTFEQDTDVDAISCAMIGQGYIVSQEVGHLSPGQVAYRMRIARDVFGLPSGVGFARQYRRGEGIAKDIREQMLPAIRASIAERLIAARKHPTAKTVPPV
jgi:hypothetical protein